MLSAKDIIAAVDLDREKVSVPEWGGDVFVSEMTGQMRDEYEAFRGTLPVKPDDTFQHTIGLRACAISICLVDEDGNRLFPNGDGIQAIGGKSAEVIDRLFDVVDKKNLLTNKYVEETEKNSDGGQNNGSGSSSPADTELLPTS